jgi:hypothetical protein
VWPKVEKNSTAPEERFEVGTRQARCDEFGDLARGPSLSTWPFDEGLKRLRSHLLRASFGS